MQQAVTSPWRFCVCKPVTNLVPAPCKQPWGEVGSLLKITKLRMRWGCTYTTLQCSVPRNNLPLFVQALRTCTCRFLRTSRHPFAGKDDLWRSIGRALNNLQLGPLGYYRPLRTRTLSLFLSRLSSRRQQASAFRIHDSQSWCSLCHSSVWGYGVVVCWHNGVLVKQKFWTNQICCILWSSIWLF